MEDRWKEIWHEVIAPELSCRGLAAMAHALEKGDDRTLLAIASRSQDCSPNSLASLIYKAFAASFEAVGQEMRRLLAAEVRESLRKRVVLGLFPSDDEDED